ncbi:MAG: phosphotriesterase family protein [Acidimicrobiia bacterium]
MRIETVTGPIGPEHLGATLMHEHVGSVAPRGFYSGGGDSDVEALAEQALSCLPGYGFGTVVDLTGRQRLGDGYQADGLRWLASRLPLHLVVGFSFYKDPWLESVGEDHIDRLTQSYIRRSLEGRAGVYGEVGTSLDCMTPREELHLRAVARAHLATGLAISTHCTLGTMALEQAAILTEEGADLGRVVLGHLDLKPDVEYLEGVLATGANIAFDTFGKEWFDYRVPGSEGEGEGAFVKWAYHRPDEDRLSALAELCARGHDDRIVLSCDMSGAEAYLNPSTHGRYGYSYLHRVVLPRLREAGVGEASLGRMLVDNPARILAVP